MADQAAAVPEYYEAFLIRGTTYMYKGVTFRRGVAQRVRPETKEYLEEHAFDDVSVGEGDDMEIERRGKFEFKVPGAPVVPAARTRKRS
ncbi:hypothetical protein CC53_gp023 [Rhizobium phage vB_RleS_L338C]|uniref:hypothetical protein n=1 Tax=Rhizobium phage vB_RleS_L338C TaxID=1414737 RepID=UPI0003D9025D|nr:hypothetical protein CC53_gp023 [Rhizobium phage vB_RleS_L338C]AHC30440.1 hypothetical protein L338C_023 [Rhizobium phage vB_RleS_L338C]QNH72156.1 hypothetical protein P11VFA_115 [Rhizobium phage P11VFA]